MSGTGADPAPPRPRQVLVSGIVAAAACALLVLTLFDALTRMRSAEVRDTVSQSLAGHNDLGVSVSQVLAVMRAVTYVSGALAAAGVVLAIYALQRHRGARAGLSVVAVVLVFTATLVAGLLPLLVGLATLRLWSRDSRDWFDGRPARARQQRPVASDDSRRVAAPPPSEAGATASWPSSGTPATPTAPGGADEPAPGPHRPAPSPYAFGAPPTQRLPIPPSRPTPEERGQADGSRPAAVALACRLTWLLCGLLVVFLLLVAVVLTGDSAALLRELDRNPRISALGASDRELLDALWLVVALGITWALAAMALAALAYRRVDGARVALVVSAVLAALLGAPLFIVGWVHAAGAVTTAVLLLQRPAREWYAGARAAPAPRQRQSPPPPPLGPPPGSGDGGKPPVW